MKIDTVPYPTAWKEFLEFFSCFTVLILPMVGFFGFESSALVAFSWEQGPSCIAGVFRTFGLRQRKATWIMDPVSQSGRKRKGLAR